MRAWLRTAIVLAAVATATIGEGGATPAALLAQHLLIAAAVVACAAMRTPSTDVVSPGPARAWLAFAACAAAGALVAPYAYAAWLVLVEITAFGALAALAAGEPSTLASAIVPAVGVVGVVHALVAIAQRIGGEPRPASTFLNPNHLGAWLGAAVLLLAGKASDETAGTRTRAIAAAAAAIALAGALVTGSRGAAMGVVAGAALLVALGWSRLTRRGRRALAVGAAAALVAVVVGVAVRVRGDVDPFRFYRTRIWRASLGAVLDSPWTGSGAGQFATAAQNLNFPVDEAPLRYERSFRTPHSDLLRAACEFGLPAALAALAAAGLFARAIVRRRSSLSPVERGAAAALAALAAQACVDDLSTRPALTALGAVLVGLLAAVPRDRAPGRPGRAAMLAAATLVAVALGAFETGEFVAWRASAALPRGPLDDAGLARLRRSIAWNPMAPDAWVRLTEHFTGDGRSWDVAAYAAAREAAEHARRLQPADAAYARGAARVEATACLTLFPFVATRGRAAELYAAAAALARTDATVPLEEAQFLLRAGDAAGARRAAERAASLEPRAATPLLTLAEALAAEGGAKEAPRVRALVDKALTFALKAGSQPVSPYDGAMRAVDPRRVEALRRAIGEAP